MQCLARPGGGSMLTTTATMASRARPHVAGRNAGPSPRHQVPATIGLLTRAQQPGLSAIVTAAPCTSGHGTSSSSSSSSPSARRHQQRRPRARPTARAAPDAAAASSSQPPAADDDDEEEGGVDYAACAPAFVTVDNSNPHYTAFNLDAQDYRGLLRVVCWVFNGMGCRVHNAVLRTDEDGRAADVFWVTDLRGRKLSEGDAAGVGGRLEDFLSSCAPPTSDAEFREFVCGDIAITNLVHPSLTQLTISADLFSPGLLLELASIIHGQGLSVVEGVVRGGSASPISPDQVSEPSLIPSPPPGRRIMRFLVKKTTTSSGSSSSRGSGKLTYDDVSALVYTLRAVLGDGSMSTRPPNTELTALSCADAGGGECASSGSDEPGSAGAGGEGGGNRTKRGKGGVTL